MVTSIQYIRGLAALLVLLHHAAWKATQYGDGPLNWFHIGDAGVDFFFLISGFIMCYTTDKRHQRPGEVGSFLKKRAMRILPLYWALTVLALLAYLLAPSKVNGGEATVVWESFFLLPSADKLLLQNGWTLSFEFYFYLLFSVGLMLDQRAGRLGVFLGLAFLAGLGFLLPNPTVWSEFLTNPIILEFGLGFGLYYLFVRFKNVPAWVSFLLMGIGVVALAEVNAGIATHVRLIDYGLPCLLITASLLFLERHLAGRKVKWFQMLGDTSYSLYLVHPFVLSIGAIALAKLGLCKGWWGPVFVAALVGGSIAAGYVCYRYIEMPFVRLFKRLEAREPKPVGLTVPA